MLTGIVVPCYNEAKRLPWRSFLDFLNGNPDYFICFVNDGSSDDTLTFLNKLKIENPVQISVLDLKLNRGKAEAVRSGMLELLRVAGITQTGFLDADLSTPLSEFKKIAVLLQDNNAIQIACGSRIRRMGARVKRSAKRHYIGRIIATLISSMLQLPFYDTQCGAKAFSRKTSELVFQKEFYSKWLFDVEIFFRMKKIHPADKLNGMIVEYPLETWIEVQDSKINFIDTLKIPLELWKISRKYKT